jgi:hypothetical protein
LDTLLVLLQALQKSVLSSLIIQSRVLLLDEVFQGLPAVARLRRGGQASRKRMLIARQ